MRTLPLLCLCLLARSLVAQRPAQAVVSVGAATVGTSSTDSSGTWHANGLVGALEARVRANRFALAATYSEGPVGARDERRTFVDGSVALGIDVGLGFEIRGGPTVRALIEDGNVTRWVHWRAGGRYATPLGRGPFLAFAEAWAAAGTSSGSPATANDASGGSVGISWRLGRADARLEYGIDASRLASRERLTVERLALFIDLRPQGGRP